MDESHREALAKAARRRDQYSAVVTLLEDIDPEVLEFLRAGLFNAQGKSRDPDDASGPGRPPGGLTMAIRNILSELPEEFDAGKVIETLPPDTHYTGSRSRYSQVSDRLRRMNEVEKVRQKAGRNVYARVSDD